MPAVADLQNSVVKEFADEPRVFAGIMSQAESAATQERVWRNFYLRGPLLFDRTGAVAGAVTYGQPFTVGLPFSRGFIIGPDLSVAVPQFGYNPQSTIEHIYELLGALPEVGDINADGDVDLSDFATFALCFGLAEPAPGTCDNAAFSYSDMNSDGRVDLNDFATFALHFDR